MRKKRSRKKLLSMVLAWALVVANVLPSVSVQAASLSGNGTEVVQEAMVDGESDGNGREITENSSISQNSQVTEGDIVSDNNAEVVDNSSDGIREEMDSSKDEVEKAAKASEQETQTEITLLSEAVAEDTTEYEIYPTPHSLIYGEGGYEVKSVNIVYDSSFEDEATKNRMEEILTSKNISYKESKQIASGKTNILIGIYKASDKGYVQTELEKTETVAAGDFEKYAAHYVISKNNTIYVLGKDADAAFYGVTTLKHVFAQMNGNIIRNFTVKDYADVNIRGFIEGYYGIPWSNEDRMSLMKFGGDFKMTSYIFAPKDDIYHTTKWRDLYPKEEIDKIEEMVAVGNAAKCHFAWTVHPFISKDFAINGRTVEEEIQSLLKKFDQLYDAGVRQFGVLSDDVSGVSYDMIIQVMEAVSQWAIDKGDVYDTLFCPQGYNHSWQLGGYGRNYEELNAFDPAFPDNIQIFWTGESVCQPITVETLEHFMTYNLTAGAEERRAPLFWLNWPVNDINHSRMLMGKGSLLRTDVNPADLAGAVTNPMQEAEASKNALFAVADYTWNIASFNADKSWEDGFKYIEPDAAEELHILAKHMSDPSPNNHGLILEESIELKEKLETYLASATGGEELKKDFEVIVQACDDFHLKSKNENFKEELLPFTNSLRDLLNAGIKFIQTQEAIDAGNEDMVWAHYSQASALLNNSKGYHKPTIDGSEAVDPGAKRLIPFVESLNTELSPTVLSMVDENRQFVTFITNRNDLSSGVLETVTDNNEVTHVIAKNPDDIEVGEYIGLAFTKAMDISSIVFKLGHPRNERDTFSGAKLEYTTNGQDWLTIAGSEYEDVRNTVTMENLTLTGVKGVRLIATQRKETTWLGIRDILINGKGFNEKPVDPAYVYPATFFYPERYGVYSGTTSDVSDRNDASFIWFNQNCNKNDAVGIDLGQEQTVGGIHFAMPDEDRMSDYTIQYSLDNADWRSLGTYTDLVTDVDINRNPIQARYIRAVSNTNTGKWLKIAEFVAKEPYIPVYPVYTNKAQDTVEGLTVNMEEGVSSLTGTVTLSANEYVGIDLERIKDITSITAQLTGSVQLQLSRNEAVWYEYDFLTPVTAYEEARYVRLINTSSESISLTLTSLEVHSHEVTPILVDSTSFGNTGSHLKAFDRDRTTEAVLQGSQNEGQYIVYDLGRVIDLESLRLVLYDSTTDYPRHAKVSVSADKEEWESVMLIGSQEEANPGEAENIDSIFDLFPTHDVSYNVLETQDINRQVRFIKFEITRTKVGADKWVRIREIELNGGGLYIPKENNPIIQSGGGEYYGNTYTNMLDGDVATLYTPIKNEDGEFIYKIHGNTAIEQITILQNPLAISNAEVMGQVIEAGEEKEVRLGSLSESLNRFDTSSYDNVLSIRVQWTKDKLPGIYEIILKRKTESTTTAPIIKKMEHSVNFNSDGGTAVKSRMAEENGKVERPINPSKTGYRFVEWTLNGESYDFSTPITESITLTARWKEDGWQEDGWKEDIEYGEILEEDREEITDTPTRIWVAGVKDKVYNGTKHTQNFRVYDRNLLLVEGRDYTVTYKNNQNAYEYTDADLEEFEKRYEKDKKIKGFREFTASKAPQIILKMKGDYAGSKTVYFRIHPLDIEDNCIAQDLSAAYNKKVQAPKPVLIYKGKTLAKNKDYTFEVNGGKICKEIGTYRVTLSGKGNFTGHVTVKYVIGDPANSMSKAKIGKISPIPWTEDIGVNGAKPVPAISIAGNPLTEDDFKITYDANQEVGTAYATITAQGGKYVGSKTVSFKITGTSIGKISYDKLPRYPYEREEIKPLERGVVIKDSTGSRVLEDGKHFFVSYQKNKDKGTATMTLTGNPKQGYTGTKKISFKIDPTPLDATYSVRFVDYEDKQIPYTASAVTPMIEVADAEGNILQQGRDYTVSYKNNKSVTENASKKPVVEIKGKGNYTQSIKEEFTIVKKDLNEYSKAVTVKVLDKVEKAGKNGWKQSFKVLDENGKVINKKEYDAVYTLKDSTTVLKDIDKVAAGQEVCVTVTFKSTSKNYQGQVMGVYRILAKGHDISKANIKIVPQEYTGKPILIERNEQLDLSKRGYGTLKVDKNLTFDLRLEREEGDGNNTKYIQVVSYEKNINKGTAKVTFKGTGQLGGEKTVTFKIQQRNIWNNWWKAFIEKLNLPVKPEPPQELEPVKVAAVETAYGSEMWERVAEAFTDETGIEVDLITATNLEETLEPSLQAGEYPDVIHLSTGRPRGLTEQLIEGRLLTDITDVLSMQVPGETKSVSEKLAGGFTKTSLTNPYGDGKTYLAPMFYSPCGLFYNAGLLEEKGWSLPKTWEEMWELGEKAKAQGISLFTYPTTGYLDAFFYSLMYSIGGPEFFNSASNYGEGIWETEEGDKYFEILGKLATYTHESTDDNADYESFMENQRLVLNNRAIFMPNGTWIVGELAEEARAEGFEWGMTAVPAIDSEGAGYTYSWMEQAFIPRDAQNIEGAKKFLAFLYSDTAAEIFALKGAVQPILGIAQYLTGDNKMFYSVYDDGAQVAAGNFAAFAPMVDISVSSVFFDPMNSLVGGTLTTEDWQTNVIAASDRMRAALLN